MVKGKVWKPKNSIRWHWQLIIREATLHAHVYSGDVLSQRDGMLALESAYMQHHNPFVQTRPIMVLGGFDKLLNAS